MIKKDSKTGKWKVDIRPNGRDGKRYIKLFRTKTEAEQFVAHITDEYRNNEPWQIEAKKDKRRLGELIELWLALYGHTLRDGQRQANKLLRACEFLNNPIAANLTSKDFSLYREKRLTGEFVFVSVANKRVASAKTVNRDIEYFRAMFNTLINLGEWQLPNPLDGFKMLKTVDRELTWLSADQIKRLLKACESSSTRHLLPVVKICLSTGARWSEVTTLKEQQVKNGKLQFFETKSGKRRFVPISAEIEQLIRSHDKHTDELFFSNCRVSFDKALLKANIQLPYKQSTHVLRRTFGVAYMQNGGNILHLQKALGHTDIQTTMVYLQFSPDELEDIPLLNPLAKLDL